MVELRHGIGSWQHCPAHRLEILVQGDGGVELHSRHHGKTGAVGDAQALVAPLGEHLPGGVEVGRQHADQAGELARTQAATEPVRQRPAQAIAHQRDGLAQDVVGGDEPVPVRLDRGCDARVLRVAAVEQRVPGAAVDEDAGHSPGSPYSARS